jgi:DNA-binding transcriptional ArsR family regulator
MVEYTLPLDTLFDALADPTRRDILTRLRFQELKVTEVAEPYDMSLAAVSKHLRMLERAGLVEKRKAGRERYIVLQPETMLQAIEYLRQYQVF